VVNYGVLPFTLTSSTQILRTILSLPSYRIRRYGIFGTLTQGSKYDSSNSCLHTSKVFRRWPANGLPHPVRMHEMQLSVQKSMQAVRPRPFMSARCHTPPIACRQRLDGNLLAFWPICGCEGWRVDGYEYKEVHRDG
jgi:hypothetical protein